MGTMTAVGTRELLYLIDEAFDGTAWHSLLGNLRSVAPEDWTWLPAELLRPRRTNWGELKETRWIIGVMIEHDLYHAGEINHIRSLRQRTDRWVHEQDQ